ncbi:MAG: hypothetical protein ABI836_03450 [Gemmatimonadota bacterium]
MLALLNFQQASDRGAPGFSVVVDSARHEVRVVTGPYVLPAMMGEGHHGNHHAEGHETPLFGFAWPVSGGLRGFSVEVMDGSHRPLPQTLLHHLNVLNLDRRQLLQPAVERVVATGQETRPVLLPPSIAIPLPLGARMAMMAAWKNPGMTDLHDVWVQLTFRWSPADLVPRPQPVLPVALDADYEVGTSDAYDLPMGHSLKTREFVMPIDGRLVAVGGHLHDYGVALRLEEVATGRVILELKAEVAPDGRLRDMPRKLPGVSGPGLALRAGRRYRVVGEYNNTSGRVIPDGAMAVIGGLFAPRCMRCWPGIDPTDASFVRDLATLPGAGWAGKKWLETPSLTQLIRAPLTPNEAGMTMIP